MQGGLSFRPFRLVERETITSAGAEFPVVLLRFALPARPDGSPSTLGFSQPTTHVKIRLPGSWLRARTFSIVSPADSPGGFSIAAKVHPGGRLTPWLASVPLGTSVPVTRTLTKRLAAPLDAPGRLLVAVSFGIGVAELVVTVRRAVEAGQHVALAAAFRSSADVVFLRELCAVVREAAAEGGSATAGRGSLTLHVLCSRDGPSEALAATAAAALEAPPSGSGDRAAAADCVLLCRGRIDRPSLEALLAHADRIRTVASGRRSSLASDWPRAAALAVGSKAQARAAYELLAALGVRQRLLGRPVVWGCW